ncbi:SgcJ/EcaC family oxidoreductase [Streptosporangium sp. NBC_01469]|uniref:SgcJ/EcaC family oxidoreductase n=1 Tax=Streptosporangium sp. NBC_01469 TaxID=2903898 RepID=UPI002E2DAEAC|nr:SgcJ/EcaC family oxidoreductase [Streptosporangium sp. NBC_01469]
MSPSTTTVDDEAAVREVPQRVISAWADNDPDAFAAVFAADATMVLSGGVFAAGRDQIRAFMASAFEGPYRGTRVAGQPISARFITPDAAVLVTKGGVLVPGETEVAPERAIRATWVLTKQDGQWLLTAYQNTPIGA